MLNWAAPQLLPERPLPPAPVFMVGNIRKGCAELAPLLVGSCPQFCCQGGMLVVSGAQLLNGMAAAGQGVNICVVPLATMPFASFPAPESSQAQVRQSTRCRGTVMKLRTMYQHLGHPFQEACGVCTLSRSGMPSFDYVTTGKSVSTITHLPGKSDFI